MMQEEREVRESNNVVMCTWVDKQSKAVCSLGLRATPGLKLCSIVVLDSTNE